MVGHDRPEARTLTWVDRGVLVYGPRKAGTTLFQNLLDGSEELLAYPAELKLKYLASHAIEANDITQYFAESRIESVISSRFRVTEYKKLWEEALAKGELCSFGEFIRFDARAVQQSLRPPAAEPQMWCAKEVGGPTDIILSMWRNMFPHGKALFIVRDPLMVTRAVLNDRRRKGRWLSVREIVQETLDPMRVVLHQSRYMNDPYVHLLTYEDLVQHTTSTMAKVAAFLDLPYSPVFETPTVFGEAQVVRTSSRETTEIFTSVDSWVDGLTLRERCIVSWTNGIAQLHPRYRLAYGKLRARIGQLQHPDKLAAGAIAG